MNYGTLVYFFLLTYLHKFEASIGDQSKPFQYCLSTCYSLTCGKNDNDSTDHFFTKYFELKLTCDEKCKFQCIHEDYIKRKSFNLPVVKYYGHWPFIRYFNLEEPASTLFSLLNITPHIYTLYRLLSTSSKKNYFMTTWLYLNTIVSSNAWIFSTIYHAKKTYFATQLDYISALLLLSYSVWLVCYRLLYCYSPSYILLSLLLVMISMFIYRVYEMLDDRISYDIHMNTCISLSIIYISLWILWCICHIYQKYTITTTTTTTTSSSSSSSTETDSIHVHPFLNTDKNIKTMNMNQDSHTDDPSNSNNMTSTTIKSTHPPVYPITNVILCLICQFWFIVVALLEIFDFPPIFYELCDAHALWHLGTIPLTFIWNEFWEKDRDYHISRSIYIEKKRNE